MCPRERNQCRKKKALPVITGDEAIIKKFGEFIRELCLEKGLSIEEVNAFIDERTHDDTHPLLARAFSLVTRQLREAKKMSRAELSEVSGLPLALINKIERAKAHDLVLTQIVRIAMALGHDVSDFVERVLKAEERLKAK